MTEVLAAIPVTIRRAREWVDLHHSHHEAPRGGRFAVGIASGDRLACVAIVEGPRARMLDDGATAEITRVASDGTKHAASKAIAIATRVALLLGYRRIISYTLLGEAGTSYRAAGWHVTATTEGGEWSRPSRERATAIQPGPKVRWEVGPGALPPDAEAEARMLSAVGHILINVRERSVGGPHGALSDEGAPTIH